MKELLRSHSISYVQGLQQELAETQERLDFAERSLSKSREEPRIGG